MHTIKPWSQLSSDVVFQEKWFRIRRDTVRKGNGEAMDRYYTFEFTDWVTVLPVLEDGRVLLVKQYRYALGTFSIEIPGGIMDAHETDPEETAHRELREETGYRVGQLIKTATIAPNPATQNNRMHCYLATGCTLAFAQELDENEEIELMLVTVEELKQLLFSNQIVQSLHISAIFYGLVALGQIRP